MSSSASQAIIQAIISTMAGSDDFQSSCGDESCGVIFRNSVSDLSTLSQTYIHSEGRFHRLVNPRDPRYRIPRFVDADELL